VGRKRQLSPQAARVVRLLADEPMRWRFGYEMLGLLGLKSGSLYPILMRLADRGLLDARWDSEATPGRPPRHLYRLTPDGLAVAAELAGREQIASPGDPGVAW
jgi:PadR family transcriptional regulator